MWFLFLLIILFVFLLLATLISSLLGFVLKLVTRIKYDSRLLILPSFLIVLLFFVINTVSFTLLNNVFHINIPTIILNTILNISNESINVITFLLIIAVMCVIDILIQSFILLCVNIDYNKVKSFFRDKFGLKLKINTDENSLVYDENKKLTYTNALVASLFFFSLIFFICVVLYVIGVLISSAIVKRLSLK